MRVTVGDSSLCYCTCVTCFERELTPLCVGSAQALWGLFCFRFLFPFFKFSTFHKFAIVSISPPNSPCPRRIAKVSISPPNSPCPGRIQRQVNESLPGLPSVFAVHDFIIWDKDNAGAAASADHDSNLHQLLQHCRWWAHTIKLSSLYWILMPWPVNCTGSPQDNQTLSCK